jgi:hypothetical protein
VTPSLRLLDLKSEMVSTTDDTAFIVMFAITIATGVCAVAGISGLSSRVSLGVLLVVPVLIPVALRIRKSMNKIREARTRENRTQQLGSDDAAVVIEVMDIETEEEETIVAAEKPQEEVGGLQLLTKPDFWLYYFSYMFSGTLGLVFLNNLGQIAESRGLEQTSTLVSLSSSFGFFGRLLPSFMDYYSAK